MPPQGFPKQLGPVDAKTLRPRLKVFGIGGLDAETDHRHTRSLARMTYCGGGRHPCSEPLETLALLRAVRTRTTLHHRALYDDP